MVAFFCLLFSLFLQTSYPLNAPKQSILHILFVRVFISPIFRVCLFCEHDVYRFWGTDVDNLYIILQNSIFKPDLH